MKRASLIHIVCFITMNLFAQINPVCGASNSSPVPFVANGKWGYLSAPGVVIPPRFDSAGPFTKDGAVACVSGHCVLIDKSGALVRPLGIQTANSYSEGLAAVANEQHKWGYVDYSAKTVIPFQFSFAHDFINGQALVGNHGKAFFIDRSGQALTPEFEGAFDFTEDLAAVTVGGKTGYIRRDGSFALPLIYEGTSGIVFSEGLVAVRVSGKVGFMDRTGNTIIKPTYDDAYPFSEGLAAVRVRENWGYIDKTGQVVIPTRYHIAHTFSEGLASVELSGKWGYIDHAGAFVLPPLFDFAMPFCGGVAQVETHRFISEDTSHGCRASRMTGQKGFIDQSGHYVWRDAEEHTWESPFCF